MKANPSNPTARRRPDGLGGSAWRRARLRAAALTLACAASLPASAQQEDRLVALVNAWRANPGVCDGRQQAPAGTLAPVAALARVRVDGGRLLLPAVKRAGYQPERAQAFHVSGPTDAAAVLDFMRQRACSLLASPEYSDIGVSRHGNDWLVVFAEPALPREARDWEAAGRAILDAVNAARAVPRTCGDRAMPAAPPLAWHPQLARAALEHSSDMAAQRYLAHRGKDGRLVGDRARRAGYAWQRIGENIASGQRTAEEAVEGWLSSPGHCANLMNRAFVHTGAARAAHVDDEAVIEYWTQVFGTPQ